MDNQPNKIRYLNGIRFKRAFVAGAKRVISRHDHLNKINVYPVSDSDTGTNISLTLSAGLKAIVLEQNNDLPVVIASFADGTLESARGNSGTIFAQWFQGFVDGCSESHQLDTKQFIQLYKLAADHAYKAVAEPVEGTILTVLQDTSRYLSELTDVPDDFVALFDLLIVKANESLQDTPNKLKMLKKFGVVDAGAQALVDFLEGVSRFIHQGDIKGQVAEMAEIVDTQIEESSDIHQEHSIDDYTYRYCTECVIIGQNIMQDELKQDVAGLGDCLVVAGSKRKTKIHMHVNDPAELFSICRRHGRLLNEKADDMFHQIKDAHSSHSDVAIVTDSALDLPQDILDSLNIHMIPIRIHVGEEAFIDRVSITPEEFYRFVDEKGVLPKTAHPTYRDFKAKYQFLASHYKSLISIHISRHMSNTIGAAELVQRDLPNTHLTIIDSLTVSAGQGLLVQYAAELANLGVPHDEMVVKIKAAAERIQIFALVGNLEYAVKGGRIPAVAKRIADWFNIAPVLYILPGRKAKILGVLKKNDNIVEGFAKKVLKKLSSKKTYRLGMIHCQAPERGQVLSDALHRQLKHIDSSYLVNCAVTIGAHSGPGTVGVAVLELDKKLKN